MTSEVQPTRYRHIVLLLLILMYAVSYIDRVCIAAVAPGIVQDFDLSPAQLGGIFTAFSVAYALFQIPGGRLADMYGPRRVLSWMAGIWGFFTLLTAGAWNQSSLLAIRFFVGVGESGAFPTASRSIFQWLPPAERGFAQGITHSGARLGGAITPVIAVWLMLRFGWQAPFILFGTLTFAWAVVWFWIYRDDPRAHPRVNRSELAHILSLDRNLQAEVSQKTGWIHLFKDSNLLFLAATHFCYVYTFWVFITWFPTYLVEDRGIELQVAGLVAGLPLLVGAVTNSLGGWLSDRIAATRGLRFGRASVAISAFLLCVLFMFPASMTSHLYWAVTLFVLSAAALECIVGVSWAASVDIGKENAGLASGIMNMSGNFGGALSPMVFGLLVEYTGMWQLPFLAASLLCLLAAGLWTRIRLRIDAFLSCFYPILTGSLLWRRVIFPRFAHASTLFCYADFG